MAKLHGIKRSHREQLSNARAANQERLKRQRSEKKTAQREREREREQERERETDSEVSDSENDNRGWYGYNSSDDDDETMDEETEEGEENSDSEGWDEKSLGRGLKLSAAASESVNVVQPVSLRWNKSGEDQLHYRTWGTGSKRTDERRLHESRELQRQASQCYDIRAMFQRGQSNKTVHNSDDSPVPAACLPPITKEQRLKTAFEKLERLLKYSTEQEQKYGYRLSLQSNYYQRHDMVKRFLSAQRTDTTGQTRKRLALLVAGTFEKGRTTAENIIRWKKSWVEYGIIPSRKAVEGYESWMTDEDVVMAVREFVHKQGDSTRNFFLLHFSFVSNLNTELSSYSLVAFLKDYVNPKEVRNPIKIRSRTARRWLNRLGYQYRYIGKNVFIDGHERPDVVKDREVFLETMKSLAPYLVEFDKDGNMLPKAYPVDCEVRGSQRRPVILITHDECVYSSNDGPRSGWQKEGDTFL